MFFETQCSFIIYLFNAIKNIRRENSDYGQSELNKIIQYTSNERISVSRLNMHDELELADRREQRVRFAFERVRKRFLSRFESNSKDSLLF